MAKSPKKKREQMQAWLLAIFSMQVASLEVSVVSCSVRDFENCHKQILKECVGFTRCVCVYVCVHLSVHVNRLVLHFSTYIHTYTLSVHIFNMHQWIHICRHAFVLTCSEHLRNVVPVCHWSVSCRWLQWRWCVPLLTLDYSIWNPPTPKKTHTLWISTTKF